ncbi:hypothetical protein BJY52DRAFT_1310599 [Lactarius psammicola]|nr:hypothetical protein BJY52DRAFT_1310599 [Lactarius psammicola]
MSKTVVSPTVSPPLSPPHSGASSPVLSRRVLQRRGSATAADPWGAHLELNMNPGRTTSCKLTIVRVNPTTPQIQLDEQPPSPQHHRRHIGFASHSQIPHRRHGSSHGHTVGGKGENTRMSFASASFAPPGSPTGPGPRPGSPTHGHHGHGHGLNRRSSAPKPRLSADQIISLAQQSCNPQSAPSSPRTPGGSLTALTAAAARSERTSFTAIPDDVFLPFVDRTDEVKALFTSPQPGARLFALLAQTFAPQSALESPVTDDAVFTTDPRKWSSAQLEFWMKQVDRDTAPDEVWVGLIRRCVLFHSELIWERIKGALGAPPELDPDGFEEDPFTADKPLTFNDFKLNSFSDFVASPAEHHPPIPDTPPQPQPASDHASESNVSVPAEDSPSISTLTIEPVLMPSSPSTEHDHPPTRPGGHRMHDISEDVLEESNENEDEELSKPADTSPQIIQGLRISTAPATPGIFAGDSPHTRLLRTSSMSSVNQLQQQQQPKTPDDFPSPPPRRSSMSSLGRRWSYAASNASSEVYNVVGERGPGNPLFPTNFARLALGPTLSANNPALRSQNLPPQPAFSNPHSIRASERGRRGKPSWAEGWDPTKHEYAVTASEGSVGGH